MNTVLKSVSVESPAAAESVQRTLMDLLRSRESQEIVIAFAGPIGAGIQSVITKTKSHLDDLGYKRVKHIKLSKFLQDALTNKQVASLPPLGEKSEKFLRYRNLQHVGCELRERTGNMRLLAEYAVKEIVVDRISKGGGGGGGAAAAAAAGAAPVEVDPPRTAYLIDQVKRPDEVELLRAMYRHLFYLVGVTKSYVQRRKTLEDEGLDEYEIDDLMDIDRNEATEKGGQRLEKTLHLADFFVRNDAGLDQRGSVRRFTRLIHGDKSLTPNRVETGMYAAYAAGLRSACLSRQVGAAIASSTGEVLATGCNDVPSAGGGLYPSRSELDFRCVHRPGKICFNDQEKRGLQNSIGNVFRQEFKRLNVGDLPEPWLKELLQSIYDRTRLGSLIEFSRSVHAEMDAIVSLARRGGSGLDKATLFTTTFPCHSCARHIVAAGISEVFYIEPYDKSMAQQLHKDAIAFEEPQTKVKDAAPVVDQKSSSAGNDDDEFSHDRVRFLHFEGVSPRLFAAVFRADDRKDKATGKFVPMSEVNPAKVLPEYLVDYREFEKAAVRHFDGMMKGLGADPA